MYCIFHDPENSFSEFYQCGMQYYNDKAYGEALEKFKFALKYTEKPVVARDCQVMIALIYLEAKKYHNSIKYLTDSIKDNEKISSVSYMRRSYCYQQRGELEKALQDISLAYEFRDKDDEKSYKILNKKKEEIINEYALEKANEHLVYTKFNPSILKCYRLFETFIGTIPKDKGEEGDVIYLLNIGNFIDLYSTLLGNKTIYVKKKFENTYGQDILLSFDLILCSVYYMCGEIDQCSKILSSPRNDLEYLFINYIESFNEGYKPKDDILQRLSNMNISTNPTIKFWLAKMYQRLRNTGMYLEIMNNLKNEYPFAMADLLEYYISANDTEMFNKLEKEALDKYGFDYEVIFIIWTYYYNKRDLDRLKILDKRMRVDNPRSLYMKAMYAELMNDTDLRDKYLNDAIEMDPTYFDIYFYLAEIYKTKDNEKYKFYTKGALEAVSSIDELLKYFKEDLNNENQKFVKVQLESIS